MSERIVWMMEPREVLDIRNAAAFLGISQDTLYNYVTAGIVPAFKLGNRWKFTKSSLNKWLDEQIAKQNEDAK